MERAKDGGGGGGGGGAMAAGNLRRELKVMD